MKRIRDHKESKQVYGFTLVELIVVVIIIGIAALMAIPMFSGASDMQVRSAANQIAADLEYARSMAVTHQTGHAVVFDVANNSYEIREDPYGAGNVINHPVSSGSYEVSFPDISSLDDVDITNANFDLDISDTITFDYLGSPYSGIGTASPMNTGQITVQADSFTLTVDIEPVTGYVTIN